MNNIPFSEEQKQYLQGFATGHDLIRNTAGIPPLAQTLNTLPQTAQRAHSNAEPPDQHPTPDAVHSQAQDRFIAKGMKLAKEEKAKRETNPFDMWPQMIDNADNTRFPKGTDVFLYKSHGLFHVTPAQDSFMCRLRFPGGALNAHQLHGLADIAEQYGGAYTHVTTRANLQIREIGPADTVNALTALHELGVIPRGSGGDNIRNVTASPTAGFDPQEIIDTLPLAKQMHHYILNHRELYGLPRKFNIAFDGAGSVTALADTNDVAFSAVRINDTNATDAFPTGVYFRLCLGGITGHKDFARDTGLMLQPGQCVPVAASIVRAFIAHGDRTNRNRARLKYLLDDWGFDKFLDEAQKHLPFDPPRFPLENCEPRLPITPMNHIGFHPQKQPGKQHVGVVVPVGKLTAQQMRDLADIATRYGNGEIRLTVWQNLIIPNTDESDTEAVKADIESAGLHWSATNPRAGLVACTGSAGCKFAAADTKYHALRIADHLDQTVQLDQPVNIHLTGCHHSCAQHYIGDIGLIATNVEQGGDLIEGYDIHTGGGFGDHQQIGRRVFDAVPAHQAPAVIESLLASYERERQSGGETFQQFTLRHEPQQLRELANAHSATA